MKKTVTLWDVRFTQKLTGGRALVIRQVDELTKNPIGHTLQIDEDLLDAGVEIRIGPNGRYDVVSSADPLDPVELGVIRPLRQRAA